MNDLDSSRLFPRLRVALGALLVAVAATACGATSEEPTATASTSDTEATESPDAVHEGLAGHFTMAAEKLDLRPEQKQKVAAIRADLHQKAAPAHAARQELGEALAVAVEKGSVDPAALAAPIAKLTQAVDALKPALQDGMKQLHDTLDPAQRKQLVELMRTQGEEGRKAMDSGERVRGHIKHLVGELGLDRDQLGKLHAALKAQHEAGAAERDAQKAHHEASRQHLGAVGDAFLADSFDPAAVDVGRDFSGMAQKRADRIARFLGTITPVLTVEQRQKLAGIIRTRAGSMDRTAGDD